MVIMRYFSMVCLIHRSISPVLYCQAFFPYNIFRFDHVYNLSYKETFDIQAISFYSKIQSELQLEHLHNTYNNTVTSLQTKKKSGNEARMVQEDMFNDSETPHKTSEAILLHSKERFGGWEIRTHCAVQHGQCTQLSLKYTVMLVQLCCSSLILRRF